jgi:hypothetical protein
MAVHHIHMDDRTAAALSGLHLFAQTGEVRGENGWKKLNQDETSLAATGENGCSVG